MTARQRLAPVKSSFCLAVFLTQIISRLQKNADAKVVLSISCLQKWNLRRQFSKIFPNIQLKGVVNRLPPFKNLSDDTNKFLTERLNIT